jgi:hypothetical protein
MAARPAPAARKAGQTTTGPPLFDGLRYFIASCVPVSEHTGMKNVLVSNGAIEVSKLFATRGQPRKGILVLYPR